MSHNSSMAESTSYELTDERLVDLDRLKMALQPGPVLILTHHNPDPDALASGDALAYLLDSRRMPASLLVG
jgi:nanoRNase/pAp phosphatase (c-di-AMP/oligoRNAs hydrolase)